MPISIQTPDLSITFVPAVEDATQIEAQFPPFIPITPEIQAVIDAKYGTLAERQAKQAKLNKPENQMEKLIDRIAQLETQVKKVP
jgi:hypothetical protein